MIKVRVMIRKKAGVLDIEGKAVKTALESLNIKGVLEARKGMFVELDFAGKNEDVKHFVEEACSKLLVNEVIEDFEYEIIK